MAMIGAFLAAEALPLGILVGKYLGVLTGLILFFVQAPMARSQWRTISLPYGLFLALGAWCYLFGRERLLTILRGWGMIFLFGSSLNFAGNQKSEIH